MTTAFHLEFLPTPVKDFPKGKTWRFQRVQKMRLMSPDGKFHTPRDTYEQFTEHCELFIRFPQALVIHDVSVGRSPSFLLPNHAIQDVGLVTQPERGKAMYHIEWHPLLLRRLKNYQRETLNKRGVTERLRRTEEDGWHPLGWQLHLNVEFLL